MNQATRTVTNWLASAHPVPAWARREFDAGIALVPTGEKFDAIRVPAPVVHAAASLVALGQSSPRQMPMTRERTP
ncbi:hypothetical protein [Streptomyces melanogenes]|uniref:Uncharacterized protein n=1 Tax=Streptomyces melanogenes TaxID=67326 RepID=A0ABZ1XSK6_9ACTN|nr:hypothetical protein [Streptomyces melanogenes]